VIDCWQDLGRGHDRLLGVGRCRRQLGGMAGGARPPKGGERGGTAAGRPRPVEWWKWGRRR